MKISRILPVFSGFTLVISPLASAQIIPDQTLPSNSQIITTPQGVVIEQGTKSGNNLFHSFSSFSVPRGEIASFNYSPHIQNILIRVTGIEPSIINGTIHSPGIANVFFLNPNGIIFGQEAKLAIGGAFLGTTAQNILFQENQSFGRNTPNFSLTVNNPIGLQFAGNSGTIQVSNIGHSLISESISTPINRTQKPLGLQTLPDATFALIGNGIIFDGGVATVNGGNLVLGSLDSGSVEMLVQQSAIDFQFSASTRRSFITLSNQSLLDGGFWGNNTIFLYGDNIRLQDGSLVSTQNLGTMPDKTITVDADTLSLEGVDTTSAVQSGLFSEALSSGDASNILVNSRIVNLSEGGGIGTTVYGQGDTGAISVKAEESLSISGIVSPSGSIGVIGSLNLGTGNSRPLVIESSYFTLSNIGSISSLSTLSRGADVNITTETLTAEKGGLIFLTALQGTPGNLHIKAREIRFQGFAQNFRESSLSLPVLSTGVENLSGIFTNSSGLNSEASTILIEAERLVITDGAIIGSVTLGASNTSNIEIFATHILLDGSSPSNAPSQIASRTLADGQAGSISIQTQDITIANGATVNTSTTATGNAGTIAIRATDKISLENPRDGILPSSISASASPLNPTIAELIAPPSLPLSGQGGQINIVTPQLTLKGNSSVSSSHAGIGSAGSLFLEVGNLLVEDGTISTSTISGDGGNIFLNTQQDVILRGSGGISATAGGDGNGGNITIHTRFLRLEEQSSLTAQAFQGQGGNIKVTLDGLLESPHSLISASSQLGLDGQISIDRSYKFEDLLITPDYEYLQAEDILDRFCNTKDPKGSFQQRGTGALPPSPTSGLSHTQNLIGIPKPDSVVTRPTAIWQGDRIVEGNTRLRLPDGRVILIPLSPEGKPDGDLVCPSAVKDPAM